MKIIASHFAITNETPDINPNPNNPATIAITKNRIARINQFAVAFLFIIIVYRCASSIYTYVVLYHIYEFLVWDFEVLVMFKKRIPLVLD